MVKMAWERGGTRARWENGEGHMGKWGCHLFVDLGQYSVAHGSRCATESCISVAHGSRCATESFISVAHGLGAPQKACFLWRIQTHAPQKVCFLWRTVGRAPQKVPRWIWPNHWTWDPHFFYGAWEGMRHRIRAFCGA